MRRRTLTVDTLERRPALFYAGSMKTKSIMIGLTVATISLALWWGCGRSGQPGKKTTIRIGAILPLTGDAAPYGNNTREGILVGVDKANEALQAKGMKMEVVFEDSKANPKDGVSATQKLIDVDKVAAIIDDSVSGVTLAVVPICDRKQVVLLSTGATAPKLSGSSKFFFRIWNSDIEEGHFVADYAARELKPKKAAVLYINNEYGQGLRQVFTDAMSKASLPVAEQESFAQGATDFRAQLVKVAPSQPDIVYLIAYPKEAKLVLKQAKELALRTTWVGTVVMLEEEMPKLLTQLGYIMYFPSPVSPDKKSEAVREFRNRFQQKYQKPPPILADVGYDAAVILGKAIAGGATSGDELRKALAASDAVDMASGTIKFDAQGDVHKPMTARRLP